MRSKSERVGRNTRTRVEVLVEQRSVMFFTPSDVLKAQINGEAGEGED